MLRLDSCPSVWSVWNKFTWVAENKAYCFLFGWNVLEISVRFICFMTSLSFSISVLFRIFMNGTSTAKNWIFKVIHYLCWGSICDLRWSTVSFTNLVALNIDTQIIKITMSIWWMFPLMVMGCFPHLIWFPISFWFKVYFVRYENIYTSLILQCIFFVYLFFFLISLPLGVVKACFLDAD